MCEWKDKNAKFNVIVLILVEKIIDKIKQNKSKYYYTWKYQNEIMKYKKILARE